MSGERDFKQVKAIRHKKAQGKTNIVGRNTPRDASEPKTAEEKQEKIDKIWQRKVRLTQQYLKLSFFADCMIVYENS